MKPTDTPRRVAPGWRPVALAATIAVLLALIYARIVTGGFLWDDDAHVTPPALRSLEGLWRIWFDVHATQQYYPLLHSWFWVQYQLWSDTTAGYHLVNLALHGIAAFLFGSVLRRLSVPGAVWAALIFAVHPVHVETAAWITEQKNTLSAVFYLAAALAYLRFDATRSRRAYLVASGVFVMALLTKSVTATLPAALLVVFWWRRGRLTWRMDVLPLLPWFAIGAAAGLFTAWVERTIIGAQGAAFDLTALDRLVLCGRVVWFYFGKLIWPAALSFIYSRWTIAPTQIVQWLPLIAAVALVAVSFRFRHRTRAPLAAVLLFGGTLFPVLGFLNVYPFRYSYVADHFQYVASLGIIALGGAGLGAMMARWGKSGRLAATGVVVALAVMAWTHAGAFRNQETLWRTTIARNPNGYLAWLNLGAYLVKQGRFDEAAALLERARTLNPSNGEEYNNLGILEIVAGRYESAVPLLREAVKLSPRSVEARDNFGHALRKVGRTQEAILQLEEALRLEPGYPVAANNLGCALLDAGRPAEALPHFETALKRSPDKEMIHHNLGNALQMLGRTTEAITHYQEALRRRPDLPETHEQLGYALVAAGRSAEAGSHFERALALNPSDAKMRTRIGLVLGRTGRLPDALAQFEAALRLDPNDATAELNRGIALTGLGRWAEARGAFARTVALQPDSAEAHRNLAMALANTGDLPEAVTHFQKALRLQPDSAETHSALSRVLRMLGRTTEADQHRDRAESLAKSPR